MKFETVIGLEIHVELNTKSKLFSNSIVSFGKIPNENTNIIDWAYPGVLPVINKKAIEFGILAANILNCSIPKEIYFERKNYFYPDNPKAYQISQLNNPIGINGWLNINMKNINKCIRINRIQIEEDAGKSIHNFKKNCSYIDLNRQGIPLLEIVTEPDISTPYEAYIFLKILRSRLLFSEISDVKMENGSMRCDANISIKKKGFQKMGVKIELKNLNSFNYIKKALIFEENRQKKCILNNISLNQETRRYDEKKNETLLIRNKENLNDYMYFPDPDLQKIIIDKKFKKKIKDFIIEMPDIRYNKYIKKYNISEKNAEILISDKSISDFFEILLKLNIDINRVIFWITRDIVSYLNEHKIKFETTKIKPFNFLEIIELINKKIINTKIVKKILLEILKNGGSVKKIIKQKKWFQITDKIYLNKLIYKILNFEKQINFKKINKNKINRILGFFIGKVMKETNGKANPEIVNEILKKEIKKRI